MKQYKIVEAVEGGFLVYPGPTPPYEIGVPIFACTTLDEVLVFIRSKFEGTN